MFLDTSVWDANEINKGKWTRNYVGTYALYVCVHPDVRAPIGTLLWEEEGAKLVIENRKDEILLLK
ncbi:hypothetical protein KSP40_PGU016239 [Platanthera guangdongensis]|uniref:Uncharacterized protein n=1 Tax=Platanthera guangdongensis TaxID=2320717 RepID=A0ABR2LEJ2_9ASPA